MQKQTSEFDNPEKSGSKEYPSAGSTTEQQFEAPVSEISMEAEAAEQSLKEILAEVDPDLLALKQEIENNLVATTSAMASAASAEDIEEAKIIGVGIGMPDPEAIMSGLCPNGQPGRMTLNVYTQDRLSTEQLLAEVSSIAGTRALSEIVVNQVPTGYIDALNKRGRIRPAPGGVSVGHFAITAGTLGCLCVGNRPPRSSRLMILSNNHVLANCNICKVGDCICQPGPYDGGKCPADQVAILESWVPINFAGGTNYVDCSTAWAWPDRVRRELMYERSGSNVFFRVNSSPVAPAINLIVGKTGRTTDLTQGRITDISATVRVGYGAGRVALFRDQITIRSTSSAPFSAGGDSGSLIWTWDNRWAPVGLLFAGGGNYTFANKIQRVVSALDVRLYT